MVSLIPRFYDVSKGSIEIDGVDIRNYTLRSLRDNIAVGTVNRPDDNVVRSGRDECERTGIVYA